ncbi:hypothetical protein D3C83_180250 [compost metagenome]
MPAAIACLSEVGMAPMRCSRRPIPAVRMNTIPATATAPSATCQGTPEPTTTEYAKKKLWPIAGATAIG